MPDGEPTRFVAERVRKAYDRALARQGKLNDHLQRPESTNSAARRRGQQLLHAAAASTRLVRARLSPRAESVAHDRRSERRR